MHGFSAKKNSGHLSWTSCCLGLSHLAILSHFEYVVERLFLNWAFFVHVMSSSSTVVNASKYYASSFHSQFLDFKVRTTSYFAAQNRCFLAECQSWRKRPCFDNDLCLLSNGGTTGLEVVCCNVTLSCHGNIGCISNPLRFQFQMQAVNNGICKLHFLIGSMRKPWVSRIS